MLQIHRLIVGDEQLLREIRLRSLWNEPNAYGSNYEREYAFVCQQDDGVVIGLVKGVAGLLIDEVIAWSKTHNCTAFEFYSEVLGVLRRQSVIRRSITEINAAHALEWK
ncbi:MAG: hypothetical protein ACYC06_02095 [Ilumatobacteraceae bacterium]